MKWAMLLESADLANSISSLHSNGGTNWKRSNVACKDKRDWCSCLITPLFLIKQYFADPSQVVWRAWSGLQSVKKKESGLLRYVWNSR